MGKQGHTPDPVQQAMKLAQNSTAQQLIKLLQTNGGQELRSALEQAAAGDYANAQQAIASLMQDPQAQKLFQQLGGMP